MPTGSTYNKTYYQTMRSERWLELAAIVAHSNLTYYKDKRNVHYTLSRDYLRRLIRPGVCALSGIPFRQSGVKGRAGPFSPSLDRIEPDLGYIEGNVRWILMGLNGLKHTGTDDDMWFIIKTMAEKIKLNGS